MTESKKITILIVLVLVWSGIFIFQYSQSTPKHLPLKYKKGEGVTDSSLVRPSDAMVRLDLLRRPETHLVISKNIFAPIYIPPPPKPKVVLPPPPPPVIVPPPPSPEEIARTQAIQAMSQFKYLGYLNKGNGKEQGFFSRGDELYITGKGEPVVGTFILKEVDPNQAILHDQQTGVESTLVLTN